MEIAIIHNALRFLDKGYANQKLYCSKNVCDFILQLESETKSPLFTANGYEIVLDESLEDNRIRVEEMFDETTKSRVKNKVIDISSIPMEKSDDQLLPELPKIPVYETKRAYIFAIPKTIFK